MGKLTVQFHDAMGAEHCLANELRDADERLAAKGDEPARKALKRRKARWEQSMSAFFFDVCAAGRDHVGEVRQ